MKKLFIQFLKSKRLYAEYCREFYACENGNAGSVKEFLDVKSPGSYLISAFRFKDSKRGVLFWAGVNYRWWKTIGL